MEADNETELFEAYDKKQMGTMPMQVAKNSIDGTNELNQSS